VAERRRTYNGQQEQREYLVNAPLLNDISDTGSEQVPIDVWLHGVGNTGVVFSPEGGVALRLPNRFFHAGFYRTAPYFLEFEFKMDSLIGNQVIFELGTQQSQVILQGDGTGIFTLSGAGSVTLEPGRWYKILTEFGQNQLTVTVGAQRLTLEVNWPTSRFGIGCRFRSSFQGTLNGLIRNLKVWE